MPFYVVAAVVRAISHQPVRLRDAKVLVLGVAFKKNVDDARHSPDHTVIKVLRDRGVGHIRYSDPHVTSFQAENGHEQQNPSMRVMRWITSHTAATKSTSSVAVTFLSDPWWLSRWHGSTLASSKSLLESSHCPFTQYQR